MQHKSPWPTPTVSAAVHTRDGGKTRSPQSGLDRAIRRCDHLSTENKKSCTRRDAIVDNGHGGGIKQGLMPTFIRQGAARPARMGP